MYLYTVTPHQGEVGGWTCRVYRESSPDWIVAAWGQSKGEAVSRARSNFDRDTVLTPKKGRA